MFENSSKTIKLKSRLLTDLRLFARFTLVCVPAKDLETTLKLPQTFRCAQKVLCLYRALFHHGKNLNFFRLYHSLGIDIIFYTIKCGTQI